MTVRPDALTELVAAELQRLGGALAPLPGSAWAQPSLCPRWSVRHVVAHLTMPARYTPEQFRAELVAAGHDFTTLSDRVAERDSALPTERLLADLTGDDLAGWVPPGGGVAGALTHVVVHGLDVTVPLGLGCVAGEDAVREVLGNLTDQGGHRHFGTSVEGRRLVAEDIGWAYGEGAPVTAPAHLLLLALAGRGVAGLDLDLGAGGGSGS